MSYLYEGNLVFCCKLGCSLDVLRLLARVLQCVNRLTEVYSTFVREAVWRSLRQIVVGSMKVDTSAIVETGRKVPMLTESSFPIRAR